MTGEAAGDRIALLEQKLAQVEARLTVREDELDVRKLQHLYGYLIDKCLYNETVDLFTDDGEVRFFGGVWKGKEGIRRLYVERFQKRFTYGNNGPIDGFLLDHPQLQDIIDIQPDGVTALARARSMMQAGRHKDFEGDAPHLKVRQWWEGGIYENTYKKVDGKWRMHILNYMPIWHGDFEKGWAHTPPEYVPFPKVTYPTDPSGPDELLEGHWLWPTHKITPFHMNHPITGKPIEAQRLQRDLDHDAAIAAK
ncbi:MULTISPECIES: nuclear transport factor 2 family protein [unclassified Novosphingobium]|uniref:nuclear transport factor 2 family protein n=1 Tax=unclassified Novosphingobium TaxID=2644732 RepID=UPI000D3012AE|nr:MULTISPECIES: nuclear transport factor 2 family protein [unclassified Novosphingobium]PTR09244.1 SnoaL-like protein [Novosphingobium sp. GV055]PUB02095.1 SnoaL-like protein [Novosphingobium sp. GV061]PUB18276.1 SnoaL-like protein [Novosphingobium sp. GV079]PUB40528.1 SnoaL-like protein [Novosphingobium sp. GV027]